MDFPSLGSKLLPSFSLLLLDLSQAVGLQAGTGQILQSSAGFQSPCQALVLGWLRNHHPLQSLHAAHRLPPLWEGLHPSSVPTRSWEAPDPISTAQGARRCWMGGTGGVSLGTLLVKLLLPAPPSWGRAPALKQGKERSALS